MNVSHKLFFIEINTGPRNDMLDEMQELYNKGWYLIQQIDIPETGSILVLYIPKV